MKAVIVGAGMGGLAASIRLAVAGLDVTVLERNPMPGGKMGSLEVDGFHFDLGPAHLTQPDVVDELLRVAGTSLADEVRLVPLDPHARYHWPDGSTLDGHDDAARWRSALDELSTGNAADWQRFEAHAEQLWRTARESFSTQAPTPRRAVLGRRRPGIDVRPLDGRRTVADVTAEHFRDPRLQQLANHAAVGLGSSPYRTPAIALQQWAAERQNGVWHVEGGVGRVRDVLVDVATRVGVEVRTGADVGRILADPGAGVTGVELADGGSEPAEVVVAGVDAGHLYTELLPHPERARALDRAGRSFSGFVICAGVRGHTEGIAHRNVWFPLRDRPEYERLERGLPAIDPTIIGVVPSRTDPTMAPPGAESWYLLVHLPAATGVDRKLMTAAVLNRLAERGIELRNRIEFTRTLVPADFDARYRAIGGAFHGTSSHGVEATFSRPSNVGPVDGLYLVGGSAHPGGGIPSVLRSAEIVAGLVAERR